MAIIKNAGVSPNQAAQAVNVSIDPELPTFNFIASWLLMIIILIFISKSRIGYVLIYYSLLLMILLILVTESSQIAPLLNNIQTVGQFNASSTKSASTP